jgi:hypothetical protein
VLEHELARLLEQHVDHRPLGGSQDDLFDELLVLHPPAVAADELHPCAGQRDLEHPGVGGVGQVDAHDLALVGGELELRLAGDQ